MRNLSVFRPLLLLAGVLALSAAAKAQVSVGVSVRIGPPALPVYEQPLCPGVPARAAANERAGERPAARPENVRGNAPPNAARPEQPRAMWMF